MKREMENWRGFLAEEGEQGIDKYKLFCDMDGVLVDFEVGVLGYMNQRMAALAAGDEPKTDGELKAAHKAVRELGGWDVEIVGQHIKRPTEGGLRDVRKLMYAMVENNYDVWANLPWIPGGKELWAHIRKYNPEILTAPMGPESERGKETWCARELGNIPVNITDDKSPYGAGDGKRQGLLIDDREKYRDQFKAGGGEVVPHTPGNAAPSIKRLKDLGFH